MVLAALKSGQSLASTARAYGLATATIVRWRDEAERVPRTQVEQQKRQDIGAQVYALVEGYLRAMQAQVEATSDPEWIKKQSADSLAILHGVYNDKAVRMLAAMRQPETIEDE